MSRFKAEYEGGGRYYISNGDRSFEVLDGQQAASLTDYLNELRDLSETREDAEMLAEGKLALSGERVDDLLREITQWEADVAQLEAQLDKLRPIVVAACALRDWDEESDPMQYQFGLLYDGMEASVDAMRSGDESVEVDVVDLSALTSGILGLLEDAGLINIVEEAPSETPISGTPKNEGEPVSDSDNLYNVLQHIATMRVHPDADGKFTHERIDLIKMAEEALQGVERNE